MASDSRTPVDPATLVDLNRYPITDLESPAGRRLVDDAQNALAESGSCILPGFLQQEAVDAIVSECEELHPQAWFKDSQQYLYPQDTLDPSLPADHPFRQSRATVQHVLAYDHFPEGSNLRRLYEWDEGLTSFLGTVLEQPVFRCADPIVSLTVLMISDGNAHGWHFDANDYVVSLLLQAPEQGGEFQYVPMIKTRDDENHEGVERVLKGETEGVVSVPLEPGTLSLFRGRYSLHRVAPVVGPRERWIVVLAYNDKPGFMFPAETHYLNAGRTIASVPA